MTLFPNAMRRCRFAVLLAASALAPAPALAATTCSVNSPSLAFGNINVLTGASVDTTATITVNCTVTLLAVDVNYSISLSQGGGGSFAPRRMSSGAYTLDYNVYKDAARSQVMGDGSGSTAKQTGGWLLLLGSATANHPIYGRIAASQQTAHVGSYTDTVTITVTYN